MINNLRHNFASILINLFITLLLIYHVMIDKLSSNFINKLINIDLGMRKRSVILHIIETIIMYKIT